MPGIYRLWQKSVSLIVMRTGGLKEYFPFGGGRGELLHRRLLKKEDIARGSSDWEIAGDPARKTCARVF